MTRINTNVSAVTAQRHLVRSQEQLNETLQRLSSGLRINKGKDDPAGLIASESLRSEMASIGKAIGNSERASNIIATGEGALSEVSDLLINIKELTIEAANSGAMTADEIRANQLQVDSAIDSITRIANATTFAGMKLLDGSLGYITSNVDTTEIKALNIYSAQLGTQPYLPVTISGVAAAERGALQYANSEVDDTITLEIASNRGVEVFSFVSGYRVSNMVSAVNAVTDATGVTVEYINAANKVSGIIFRSVDYGTDAFVSVRLLPSSSGTFDVTDTSAVPVAMQRDAGADVEAVINGTAVTGDGVNVTLNTTALDMNLKLDTGFGAGDQTTFEVTGGGAMFQLGPQVNSSQKSNLGIQSIVASRLGSIENGFLNEVATGGAYSLTSGNAASAADIVDEAIDQIAILRGRLGAFERNTLETNINALRITLENVTSAESSIRDADFAAETAALTRSQILVQAGTSVLALANSTPQSVLALLQ